MSLARRLRALAVALSLGGTALAPGFPLAQEAPTAAPLDLRLEAAPFDFRPPLPFGRGPLKPLAAYVLRSDHPQFGGISSLAFGPDGALYAVNDVGRWMRFALEQDAEGRLTGLSGVIGDLSDGLGAFPKEDSDSEALAFAPDGKQAFVAFERKHRIWRYDLAPAAASGGGLWPGRAARAHAPAEFQGLMRNRGIESLGVLPDGALLAVGENSRPGEHVIPGWVLRGEEVEEFSYLPRDGFLPTDLEIGPDGFVYMLERRVSFARGWAARIRRFPLEALRPGGIVDPAPFAEYDNRRQTLDNMEGLAIRMEGEGEARRMRFYLISDDNFLRLQRTLLIQFELLEAPS